jgi:hypothetical protein
MGNRLRRAENLAVKAVVKGFGSYPLRKAQVKFRGNRLNLGGTG